MQAYTWEPAAGYSEPPRQYRPVGQCLAWLLVQQGKLDEAARLYAKVGDEGPCPVLAWPGRVAVASAHACAWHQAPSARQDKALRPAPTSKVMTLNIQQQAALCLCCGLACRTCTTFLTTHGR